VKEYAAGKVEYRTDKGGNIHAVVGKLSFPDADLAANIDHFIKSIEKIKPSTVKGMYIKKIALSGAMTPSVQSSTSTSKRSSNPGVNHMSKAIKNMMMRTTRPAWEARKRRWSSAFVVSKPLTPPPSAPSFARRTSRSPSSAQSCSQDV